MNQRAYSILEVKAVNDDERVIEGIATTPETDRMGDVVDPKGAKFKLPLPLLFQHDSSQPIGHVERAKVSEDGITIRARFAKIDEPGKLKDRLDEAWQSVKSGLVRGLSIGFRAIDDPKPIKGTFGLLFDSWEWLELSAVVVPANAGASITAIKSADQQARAASGKPALKVVRLSPPGASGQTQSLEERNMATLKEQIAAFEAKRSALAARQNEIQQKAMDEGRSKDGSEKEEFDNITAEIEAIDGELKDLRVMEKQAAQTAAPVKSEPAAQARQSRPYSAISVRSNLEKGTIVARYLQALVRAHEQRRPVEDIIKADNVWMRSSPELVTFAKAAVAAGDTTTSGWADDLVYAENLNQFIEYLRPKTIMGRVEGFSRVPFNIRVAGFDSGTTAYWVGQGKAIPVSKPGTTNVSLAIAKAAGLVSVTKELARLSTPSAEMLVRDELTKALVYLLDDSFINPNNGGITNEKPASMTYGVTPTTASGTTYAAFRTDVQALFETFFDNHIDTMNGVWIMSHSLALKLSMMVDSNDRVVHPNLTPMGGTMLGYKAIVSQVAQIAGSPQYNDVLIFLCPSEVFLADDGQAQFSVSDQASIELLDNPTNLSTGGTTATSVVSMYQTESVAIKAVRFVNWTKKRSQACAWIQNAAYVG
jgi:HK97 family phage major capsid protein/HK97 family phage prohead protease